MGKHPVESLLTNAAFEPNLIQEILQNGRLKRVRGGQMVIRPGSKSQEMPLVIKGLLKVMRHDFLDNEIFLYYIEGGQTCAMSISCCLEAKPHQFKVMAEEAITLN